MNIYVFSPLQYNKCSGVFFVMKKIIAIVNGNCNNIAGFLFLEKKVMNLILIQNHAY